MTGRFLLLLALVALTTFVALTIGAAGVPLREVVHILAGGGDSAARVIVLQLRLPRALLALLAGGGLALSGAVFQALLRNALAEPYVLGVAGGAAVGAVGAVVLGVATIPGVLPLAALAGAITAVAVLFRIAIGVGRALDTRVLLLAGVVAGAFFNAITLLLLTFADVESFRSAIFWTMGSLAGSSWRTVAVLAAYALPAMLLLIALARPLNLLAIGEETALYLGTRVELVKFAAYFVASLLVAACVALCGVIGFIGLVVPHTLRLLWGADHRFLLPACVLAGGVFLLLADTAARILTAPAELPVGVVTAMVGVPLFLTLLRRTAV